MYFYVVVSEVFLYVLVAESCESVLCCDGDIGDLICVREVEDFVESFSVLVQTTGFVVDDISGGIPVDVFEQFDLVVDCCLVTARASCVVSPNGFMLVWFFNNLFNIFICEECSIIRTNMIRNFTRMHPQSNRLRSNTHFLGKTFNRIPHKIITPKQN